MEILIPGDAASLLENLLSPGSYYQGGHTALPDVSEDDLVRTLDALARGNIEYIIVRDRDRFIQAAGDEHSGYVLEYNDGSPKEQFRATRRSITGAELRSALIAYLNRDRAWQSQFSWEKFKL